MESSKNYEHQKLVENTLKITQKAEIEKLILTKEITNKITNTIPTVLIGIPISKHLYNFDFHKLKGLRNFRGGSIFPPFIQGSAIKVGKWLLKKGMEKANQATQKKRQEDPFESLWKSLIDSEKANFSNSKSQESRDEGILPFFAQIPFQISNHAIFPILLLTLIYGYQNRNTKLKNLKVLNLFKVQKKEEKSFLKYLKKTLKKNFSWLVFSPQGILLIIFLFVYRKAIFRVLTNPSDRDQLIQTLQQAILMIGEFAEKALKEGQTWTQEFYQRMLTYNERDAKTLVQKELENQSLRKQLGILRDSIYHLQLMNQKNINSLENCNNAVRKMHRDANEIHTQNAEFYGDLIALKKDLIKLSSSTQVAVIKELPQKNAIQGVLEKTYHAIKPSSDIKESTPPVFPSFELPERSFSTTEDRSKTSIKK
jgi:hypothetical protein